MGRKTVRLHVERDESPGPRAYFNNTPIQVATLAHELWGYENVMASVKDLREAAKQKRGLPPVQYYVYEDDPDGLRLRIEERGVVVYVSVPNVMYQKGQA